MSDPKIDVVLDFLKEYKTRKEIEEKFSLSNTQSFNLLNWLKKSKLIEEVQMRITGRTNRQWFYRKL